jgi:hypothetical protein
MKIVKLVRWGVLALVAFAAMAQTSPQQKQPQNESQVKAIRFDFVFKTVETPNFQSMGTPSAYRADDSWQPTSDQRYRIICRLSLP